jgi:large subunit ribosomal protein L11
MAKKVKAIVKLQLAAGKATPAYPVGPTLGQHGINLMLFVKEYNEKTANQTGLTVPVEVTVFEDRSFTTRYFAPTTAALLRKMAGIDGGSSAPNRTIAGQITPKQLREIAQTKLNDLNTLDLAQAEKMILGTARSMGIKIVDK